jgi:hypothetical protein
VIVFYDALMAFSILIFCILTLTVDVSFVWAAAIVAWLLALGP